MDYYLVCRSQTYAQRAERVLRNNGISARIIRSPRGISASGCSYSLRLAKEQMPGALVVLRRNGFTQVSVFIENSPGNYHEVVS